MKRTMLVLFAILGLCCVGAYLAYGQERSDREFAEKATLFHLSAIQMGTLAGTQAFQKEVQAFGQQSAREHQKSLTELSKLAASRRWKLPVETDKTHRDAYKVLGEQKREDFDRMYVALALKTHKDAMAFYQTHARASKDKELGVYAEEMTKKLKDHLSKIQSLQAAKNAE